MKEDEDEDDAAEENDDPDHVKFPWLFTHWLDPHYD